MPDKMTWTEAQIIEIIEDIFKTRKDISPKGIGDDCAVIDLSGANKGLALITTDASVENVHFNLNWMTLADAAYRCMTSNISDIAAMGAYGGPFTLALGLNPNLTIDEIREAIDAIRQCIEDHGLTKCWLVGGDVVRSDHTFFSITLLGNQPEWPVVYRNGAKPGDTILAIGNIGMSAAGLDILTKQRNDSKHTDLFAPFIQAFKRPVSCAELGPELAKNKLATAMMDISDGIQTDLPRLLKQSQCGAEIQLEAFNPSHEMKQVAQILQANPVEWMTCGGEDFGLIMTCKEKNVIKIQDMATQFQVPCHIIGKCRTQTGVLWKLNGNTIEMKNKGFVHFS